MSLAYFGTSIGGGVYKLLFGLHLCPYMALSPTIFILYLGEKGLNLPLSVYITLTKSYFLFFRCFCKEDEKFTLIERKALRANYEEE